MGFVYLLWSVDMSPTISKCSCYSDYGKENITRSGLLKLALPSSTDHNLQIYLWLGPLPKNWIIFLPGWSFKICSFINSMSNALLFRQEAAILQVLLWYTLNTHICISISYLNLLCKVSTSSISATSLTPFRISLSLSFDLANKKFGQKFSACLFLPLPRESSKPLKLSLDSTWSSLMMSDQNQEVAQSKDTLEFAGSCLMFLNFNFPSDINTEKHDKVS